MRPVARCIHFRLFCALLCCLLLLQLCLLFDHLRSTAFSPFSTGFCNFCIFHASLSPIFHTSLSPFFFINSCAFSYSLSSLLPDETSGRQAVNSTVCCCTACCSLNCYTSILFVLHQCRNFFSVAHFGKAILVFCTRFGLLPAASTSSFVQPPTFVRFLIFLYCVFLPILYISNFAVTIFHTSLSPFSLHQLIRFLIL